MNAERLRTNRTNNDGGRGAILRDSKPTMPLSFGLVVLALATPSTNALMTRPSVVATPGHFGDFTVAKNKLPPTRTRLLYAHGDSNMGQEPSTSRSRLSSWWSTVFTPTEANQGEEQQVVDEYLEFLDRRYHRLHDDQVTVTPPKQFNAWEWLTDNSSRDESYDPHQSQEDALFALGVAGLASERLLQKHHIPSSTQPQKHRVIDTKATPLSTKHKGAFTSGLFGEHGNRKEVNVSSVLLRMKSRRRSLIAYQDRQLRRILEASLKTLVKAPVKVGSAVKTVWAQSGGKRTLALTLTALTSFFVLLRPLVQATVGVIAETGFHEA